MKEMQNHGCDVLVTDISMIGFDGIDVLQWVRAAFPQTRCLVLSGIIEGRILVDIKTLADAHLIKPVKTETLVARIEDVLNGKPGPS
jgi:DNA-binding NarL/FixJ family response regulator